MARPMLPSAWTGHNDTIKAATNPTCSTIGSKHDTVACDETCQGEITQHDVACPGHPESGDLRGSGGQRWEHNELAVPK